MRGITKDEIEEYFRFAGSHYPNNTFTKEQHQLIGDAAVNSSSLIPSMASKLLEHLTNGADVYDIVLTIWVTAFQMGRECESRLSTQALKKSPFVTKH